MELHYGVIKRYSFHFIVKMYQLFFQLRIIKNTQCGALIFLKLKAQCTYNGGKREAIAVSRIQTCTGLAQ